MPNYTPHGLLCVGSCLQLPPVPRLSCDLPDECLQLRSVSSTLQSPVVTSVAWRCFTYSNCSSSWSGIVQLTSELKRVTLFSPSRLGSGFVSVTRNSYSPVPEQDTARNSASGSSQVSVESDGVAPLGPNHCRSRRRPLSCIL